MASEERLEPPAPDEVGELPYLPPAAPSPDRAPPPPDQRERDARTDADADADADHDAATPTIDDTATPTIDDTSGPALPPRRPGDPVSARTGPPPNAPIATTGEREYGATEAAGEGGRSEPDPEVLAALRSQARHIRRRNRVAGVIVTIVVVVAVVAAAYIGYQAYDRDQDERQPPTTERPSSEELLEELDG